MPLLQMLKHEHSKSGNSNYKSKNKGRLNQNKPTVVVESDTVCDRSNNMKISDEYMYGLEKNNSRLSAVVTFQYYVSAGVVVVAVVVA